MTAVLPVVSRRHRLVVALILAVGLFVRLWTIGYGAPYGLGVDEPEIMRRVVTMLKTGSFHPQFWDYGGVTFYLHMAVAGVRFLAGAQAHEWNSLGQIWDGNFYLSARIVTTLIGVLTIVFVYRSAIRWGLSTALIAAAAMAVQPQHVRESQYALTDTPLTCLVALTMLLSLRASEDGRLRKFFWAGLIAGLAGATKYNGILALIMPVAAALAARGMRGWPAASVAVGGGVAGFVIGEPYAFFDLPGFLNGFAGLMQAYNKPTNVSDTFWLYFSYIRGWFSWRGVLSTYYSGLLGLWLSLIGLLTAASQVARQSMRAATLILLPFPLLFLWFIAHQSLQFGRYALPIVPMLCICYATGVVIVQRVLFRRPSVRPWMKAVVTSLLLIPLGFQLATDVGADWRRRQGHTVEQAGAWLLNNVDPKDHIVSEAEGLRLPPRFTLSDPPMRRIIDHSVDEYRAQGYVYVVLSSSRDLSPDAKPPELARYRELMDRTAFVQRFSLGKDEPTITILKFVR